MKEPSVGPILALLLLSLPSCAAVFPEVATPAKAPPPGAELDPPPPSDVVYVAFAGAEIPTTTRDGRKWDSVGGTAPDAFAKVLVDEKEIFRTSVEPNTLTPTWADQPRSNYRLSPSARVRVEIWDSNPINDHPICIKALHDLPDQASPEPIHVECDSGAHFTLRVEKAHARVGLGLLYELRTGSIYVSRVLAYSPAARAKLAPGEQIMSIEGRPVAGMDAGEIQSAMNANSARGVKLGIHGADGKELTVELKDGPIYPLPGEGIPLD